jgi:hypothetical protein
LVAARRLESTWLTSRHAKGAAVAVKLHRCSTLWAKAKGHPCWRVQHALDEAGVPYEIVKETPLLRGRRTAVIAGTGQSKLPAIQFEDGSWYRKESSEMAEEILAGALSDRSPGHEVSSNPAVAG